MSNSNLAEALADSGLNPDQVQTILDAGEADVAAAKPVRKPTEVRIKVSEKGCVSILGGTLRIRGVHLYPEEWVEILSRKAELYEFIVDEAEALSFKDKARRDKTLAAIMEETS